LVKDTDTGVQAEKWIRWLARGISSLAAGFWLFVGIVAGISETEPWTVESVILAGLILCSAVGVLIAWFREGMGGGIVVACAIAHSTFAYIVSGHNKGFAMLITGGPLLLSGILFLISWWKSKALSISTNDA